MELGSGMRCLLLRSMMVTEGTGAAVTTGTHSTSTHSEGMSYTYKWQPPFLYLLFSLTLLPLSLYIYAYPNLHLLAFALFIFGSQLPKGRQVTYHFGRALNVLAIDNQLSEIQPRLIENVIKYFETISKPTSTKMADAAKDGLGIVHVYV